MDNTQVGNKAIDELLHLVDDGTLTELERSIVTQSLEKPAELEPQERALVEELRQALHAATLPGEDRRVDRTIVQSIVAKLQAQPTSEPAERVAQRSADTQQMTVGDCLNPVTKPAPSQDRQELSDDLRGQTIGNYQLIKLIGRGGMGAVYEASDQLLHRRVALKIMLPAVATNAEHRERFLREARAAARVEHDHICPIYQVGEDRGIAYIAMPLLSGETLERRLERERLSPLQIIDFLEQIAQGLDAAHQVGLIHRDIKPANIWIESRKDGHDRVRLLDFGLAQMEADEPHLTQPGSIMGTPAYMSPEQARGHSVDGRTDLFSVGAVLYELLTGTRAFVGKTPTAILSSILVDSPLSPAVYDRTCPRGLSDLALALLEKDQNLRLPSASRLLVEVAKCRQQLAKPTAVDQGAVHRISASASTIATDAAPIRTATMPSGGNRKGPAWLWPMLLAAGFGGLMLTVFIMFRTPSGTLVVEASDEAKVLFKDGQLQIMDESGKVAYRLTAQAPSQELSPGKYQIRVVGVDGLSIDTESFVIKRNEKTHIHVTAVKNSDDTTTGDPISKTAQNKVESQGEQPLNIAAAGASHSAERARESLGSFAGRAILQANFSDAKQWPLPLVNNATVESRIEGGLLVATKTKFDAKDPFITLPMDARLNRGALAVRCRSTTGRVFFSFCTRQDGQRARWLSLSLLEGGWSLFLVRQDKKDNVWQDATSTRMASSTIPDHKRAKENWASVAMRWSEKDFDVWIDGEHIAGGTLPSDELTLGQPTPSQVCVRNEAENLATLEIDQLGLWDQADVPLEDTRKYSNDTLQK